jgi:hypothetical protein
MVVAQDVAWYGDGQRERVVRGRGQHRIVPVVFGGQHHHQVVMEPGDDVHPFGRCSRPQLLRVGGHRAVECNVPVQVLDDDACCID